MMPSNWTPSRRANRTAADSHSSPTYPYSPADAYQGYHQQASLVPFPSHPPLSARYAGPPACGEGVTTQRHNISSLGGPELPPVSRSRRVSAQGLAPHQGSHLPFFTPQESPGRLPQRPRSNSLTGHDSVRLTQPRLPPAPSYYERSVLLSPQTGAAGYGYGTEDVPSAPSISQVDPIIKTEYQGGNVNPYSDLPPTPGSSRSIQSQASSPYSLRQVSAVNTPLHGGGIPNLQSGDILDPTDSTLLSFDEFLPLTSNYDDVFLQSQALPQAPSPSSKRNDFHQHDNNAHDQLLYPTLNNDKPVQPPTWSQTYSAVELAAQDLAAPPILREIDTFFNYQPPPMITGAGASDSGYTRKPSRYDMHMASDRVLKHVIYCPELETDLRNIANKVVLQRLDERRLPPVSSGFPTKQVMDRAAGRNKGAKFMQNEAFVEEFYAQTMGKHVSELAATLEFGHREWSDGVLEYTSTLPKQRQDGVADGFLGVYPSRLQQEPTLSKIVPLDGLGDFRGDEVFLTVEVKSLIAGSLQTLKAILELSNGGEFEWQQCVHGHMSDACKAADSPENGTTGDHIVIRHDMGPDATGQEASALWAGVKSASVTQQWKVDPGDQKPTATHRKHGKWILQQIWTQASKHDLTLFLLTVGGYEIACWRDRCRQAIYLSGIINVHECKYGELQLGLYIAAIRDARIRKYLRNAIGPMPRSGDPSPAPQVSQEDLFMKAFTRNQLVLTFQNQLKSGTALNSVRACRQMEFYTREPVGHVQGTLASSSIMRIHISEVKKPSVLFGTLRLDNTTFTGTADILKGVIVKIADNEHSIKALEREYKNYCHLAKNPVTRDHVPMVIGFFSAEYRCHVPPSYLLVMEYVGEPVRVVTNLTRRMLGSVRDPFKSALSAIHTAGLLHTAITPHHLLIRDYSKRQVAIISFSHATPSKDDKAQAREVDFLVEKGLNMPAGTALKRGATHDTILDENEIVDLESRIGTESPQVRLRLELDPFPHDSYVKRLRKSADEEDTSRTHKR